MPFETLPHCFRSSCRPRRLGPLTLLQKVLAEVLRQPSRLLETPWRLSPCLCRLMPVVLGPRGRERLRRLASSGPILRPCVSRFSCSVSDSLACSSCLFSSHHAWQAALNSFDCPPPAAYLKCLADPPADWPERARKLRSLSLRSIFSTFQLFPPIPPPH